MWFRRQLLAQGRRCVVGHAKRVGTGHALLDAVLETNANQPSQLVNIVERELGSLEGATVVDVVVPSTGSDAGRTLNLSDLARKEAASARVTLEAGQKSQL